MCDDEVERYLYAQPGGSHGSAGLVLVDTRRLHWRFPRDALSRIRVVMSCTARTAPVSTVNTLET